ncbi:HTH-type transcriptional activator IlvY [Thalassotalea nanhaiensis]|uniref:HTH-type transcriptional activator IlvY n=1 Tax=Thalassotalea nanhaiensis TaxID=3065648 RepID=A0ABY9TIN4_9GAMM|nr:HTH-type transcriptional activator IlvY [Colwelliaceae bacterium SQ345]
MDIKSLQVFTHLANTLHFGQTAHAHHVSPSTLSRMIQRIEEEVGCKLLQRDNRTAVLTKAGVKFEAYANQQLQQWQEFQGDILAEQPQLTGKLSIYCSVTAAYSHLPQLLDGFRRLYPQIEIMLETGNAEDAVGKVIDRQVDFAIAAHPESLAKSCYFHAIAQIPVSIIAPLVDCQVKQQLEQRQVNWQDIPIILPEHGPARNRFEKWYRQKGEGKPNIYATVAGHEALVSMVALGCGVGVAPEVVLENSPVKDRVQRLTVPSAIKPFELGICCLKKRMNEPVINAFMATVLES